LCTRENELGENTNSKTALIFPPDHHKFTRKFHGQLTPHHAADKKGWGHDQGCQLVRNLANIAKNQSFKIFASFF